MYFTIFGEKFRVSFILLSNCVLSMPAFTISIKQEHRTPTHIYFYMKLSGHDGKHPTEDLIVQLMVLGRCGGEIRYRDKIIDKEIGCAY